jgi:outer membrane protein assembly factor BamB
MKWSLTLRALQDSWAAPTASILALAGWLLTSALASAQPVEPWATYRGNAQRTGNTDGIAGPQEPKVLWVLKSKDHYIASPVPAGDRLFVSGLGAFNVAHFACLSTTPDAKERMLWSKTAPYLKLPTVSSPALTKGGQLVFGDGMHQTDGATLHCMNIDSGLALWQYPVPGRLVHLEGSPTIVGNRVYLGGGAAGVFCVELDKAKLEGQELDLTALQKSLAQRWQELLAAYEKDKLKNEFAVPPTDDQLPRAQPKQFWRRGEDKWHVDAPVAVVDGNVLVASAFLPNEKVGDRAVFCLDAKDGTQRWRVPLDVNPWGGPAVLGKTVIVGGSSIGYDTKAIKGAKGEIVALDLVDGTVKWRKAVKGGIVSTVALTNELAIATATDGKVRAFDLADGSQRWNFDAGTPFFAPPALAGEVAYVGDLKGVIHAIDIATGTERWKLHLATHPQVQTPGMVYGGPIVHKGRLYVATCNLEGANAQQPTVVVCIADK